MIEIYGIYSEVIKGWCVLGDGTVFNTPYVQVAMAQLHEVKKNWFGDDWRVAMIGENGEPITYPPEVKDNAQ